MANMQEQHIIQGQAIIDFYNHDIENNINGREINHEDYFVLPDLAEYPEMVNNVNLFTNQYNNNTINFGQYFIFISNIYQTIEELRQADAVNVENVENIANNDLEAQAQTQAEGQQAQAVAVAEEDNIQPFQLFPEIEQEQVIDVDIVVEEEYQDPMSVLLCVPISQETFGDCSICYKQMVMANLTITRCGHAFHASCLNSALEVRCTCPLCRTQLVIEELD